MKSQHVRLNLFSSSTIALFAVVSLCGLGVDRFGASLFHAPTLRATTYANYPKIVAEPKTPAQRVDRIQFARMLSQDMQFLNTVGRHNTWDVLLGVAACQMLSDERHHQAFYASFERTRATASAQIAIERNPFAMFALRVKGKEMAVWQESPYILPTALKLNSRWLSMVRDNTPMPSFQDEGKRRPDQIATYKVYCQAILYSTLVPLDAFQKSAEENKHVGFAQLWNQSPQYRGQVIRISGRLKRLRKWPAPIELRKQGIPHVYEGWIFGDTVRSHPYCVIFPFQPQEPGTDKLMEPAESMTRQVEFYGYYIKKMRYTSGEGDRDTPYFIGPTVIPIDAPAAADDRWNVSNQILAILIGSGTALIVLMLALAWWFRRGDERFRNRLRDMHQQRVSDMLEAGTDSFGFADSASAESSEAVDSASDAGDSTGIQKPPESSGS